MNHTHYHHACIRAIENGRLETVLCLWPLLDWSAQEEEEPFLAACNGGHLHVAKWLWEQGRVDLHAQSEDAFRSACANGHIDVAKWLWDLGQTTASPIDVHAEDAQALASACAHGDLDFVQWLWDKAPTMDHLRRRRDSIFYVACRDGKLEVAKWVWNASGRTIDIRAGSACAFRNACVNGHLEVVKWLAKTWGLCFCTWDRTENHNNQQVVQWLLHQHATSPHSLQMQLGRRWSASRGAWIHAVVAFASALPEA